MDQNDDRSKVSQANTKRCLTCSAGGEKTAANSDCACATLDSKDADVVPILDGDAKKTLLELLTVLDAIDKRAKGIRT